MHQHQRSTDGVDKKADSSIRGGESAAMCAVEARPTTVLQEIDSAIESHNRGIARLMKLRDETPMVLLAMPVEKLRALGWPSQHPF